MIEKNGIDLDESGISSLTSSVSTVTTNQANRTQFFQKNITSAANAGAVDIATVAGVVFIEAITVRSKGATTANLTNITVVGGTLNVIEFVDDVTGVQANLDATDKQVAWEGYVELPNAVKIQMVLTGIAGTAVDLQVTIKYRSVSSGSLS
jgi:hypothetical protein